MELLIQSLKKFGNISENDFLLLKPFTKNVKINANEFYLNKGTVCHEVLLICKGSMRAYYLKEDGLEVNILLKSEGEFIADYESFLTQDVAQYSIQALEDTEAIALSRNGLYQLANQSMYFNTLARYIAESNYLSAKRRAEDLLFLSPKQRYEKVLKENPHFLNRFPLKHIAAYVGIRQQSLSRIRAKKY